METEEGEDRTPLLKESQPGTGERSGRRHGGQLPRRAVPSRAPASLRTCRPGAAEPGGAVRGGPGRSASPGGAAPHVSRRRVAMEPRGRGAAGPGPRAAPWGPGAGPSPAATLARWRARPPCQGNGRPWSPRRPPRPRGLRLPPRAVKGVGPRGRGGVRGCQVKPRPRGLTCIGASSSAPMAGNRRAALLVRARVNTCPWVAVSSVRTRG